MPFRRLALLAALTLALGGCFNVDQTLKATGPDEASFEVRAAVPATTIAAAQNIPGVAGRPFCADKDAAEKLGLTVTVDTYTEGADQICVMKARGPMATIAKVAEEKSYLPKDAPPQAQALSYTLEDAGSGLWRLTMTLTPPAELKMIAGSDDITRMTQTAIFGSTDGKGITWGVEASEIVDSTGNVSPDKKRAEFKLPLGDLLAKPEPEYRFVTTFRP